jgi:spermidine synthase
VHPPPAPRARLVSALGVAFVLSGAAGLIHEIVWTRLLGLVFGVTEMAIATVLAAFMGGLAIGSWLVGGRLAGPTDGRRLYARLEIGIGLAALAVPLALALVEPLYGWLWRQFHFSFAVFSALRFVVAGAVLLAPTIMMGATFPALAAYLRAVAGDAAPPQWLYTLNLAGAGLGVGAAGFLLLPAVGIRATILVAALINVGVGLWVWRMPAAPAAAAPPRAPAAALAAPSVLLAAAALSGLTSFATQVAWTRSLAPIVGSTTYAFTAVLLVYLAALALGSAWATWRARRARDVAYDLVVMHLVAAGLALAAIGFLDEMPRVYLRLYEVWDPSVPGGSVARACATAVMVLLAPVAAAGTLLPLALIALLPHDVGRTAAAVGRVYALNTVGAIAGAVLAGFVLVPGLGTQRTLTAMALATAAMGVALAARLPARARLVPAAALVASGIAAWGLGQDDWNQRALNVGVYEPGREAAAALRDPWVRVVFHREGPTASVVVMRWDDPEPDDVINGLLINGRANASDSSFDLATQVILAQLPLLVAPRTDRMLIVGWGSGVTVGSATQSDVRHVDAIELEPAVVHASALFEHVNLRPLDDPRVTLHVDDARHLLLASRDRYDVIVSEPSHPWLAGVANLFTEDFYRIAAERLTEDGVFAQWLQTYQISWDAWRSLLGAFQSVFPEVLVFRSPAEGSSDTVLLGTRRPLRLDLAEIERRWSDPRTRADLARIGLGRVEALLALLYVGTKEVRDLARGAARNTDDSMYVEFRGARDMAGASASEEEHIIDRLGRLASPIESYLTDPQALLRRERLDALMEGLRRVGRPTGRYEALARGPEETAVD